MKAFSTDRFAVTLPPAHRFPMAKYRLLRERVAVEGLIAPDRLLAPPAARWRDIRLVHDAAYTRAVFEGSLPPEMTRRIGLPWSPALVERARRSVGATLEAARAAVVEGVAVNLAGGTHHAFADRGEGYCVFNDVAIAARLLLRDTLAARVAIVDCDVHQGNGTARLFAHDPRVFTFSIHGEHNYPFHKESSDLDEPLPDGTRDRAYLDRLDRAMVAVMRHRPDFVLYVSGADPYEGDRLGRLSLSIDGLRERDRCVVEHCGRARVPVVVTMGGGYAADLEQVVTIHTNTVREALGYWQARRTDPRQPATP